MHAAGVRRPRPVRTTAAKSGRAGALSIAGDRMVLTSKRSAFRIPVALLCKDLEAMATLTVDRVAQPTDRAGDDEAACRQNAPG